jgi:putative pyruvate formate lyase activating enzyme
MNGCKLCPRECNVDRAKLKGYCGAGDKVILSKAYLHKWEEPCISGDRGSGTVFFSGCNLKCVFCQNYKISHECFGKEITNDRLSDIFMELQLRGAHNINLVTPTHFIPQIKEALDTAKSKGLNIPIVYNSSGYELVETIKSLEGYIDIYLPDIKYYDDKYSIRYSNAPDYFKYASSAVLEMVRQVGVPEFDESGMLKSGLMIRHLMLPGLLFDSKKIVDFVAENLPKEVYLNIMCQYVPLNDLSKYPEINRRVNKKCYDALIDYALDRGIENGYFQEFESADTEFIPDFNLEGI